MTEPTGYTAVGMVGFTDQGTYSASASYVKNDLVHYGGSIWCCLIDDTMGIEPTAGVNWRFWVEDSQNGISDIVNVLGAKNLLKVEATSQVINGVTFTINDDGSITVNGTATATIYLSIMRHDFGNVSFSTDGRVTDAEYIISGLPTNNRFHLTYDVSAKAVALIITSGTTVDNVTFYPMIRPKGIADDTWQPYTKTNKELTSDIQTLTNETATINNVLGAKNVLPNNATTQVINNVTFTVNSDKTVTASGTASGGDAQLTLSTGNTIKKGTYILSGCPSGGKEGSTVKYALYLNINGTIYNDTGTGTTITFANDVSNVTFMFGVANGQSVNGTVKPMLRPANIVNGDYVPYAMTNRELTEIIEETGSVLSFTIGAVTDLYIKKCGRVVTLTGKFYNSSAVTSGANVAQGTISSKYKPICFTTSMAKRGTDFGMFSVVADGTFSLSLLSSSSLAANRWLEVGITFLV